MAMFDAPTRRGTYVAVEQRVEAFFCALCGLPPPAATALADESHRALTGRPLNDPYRTWWALAAAGFKEAHQLTSVSYRSSRNYHAVLLQELLVPPEPCPLHVRALIDDAAAAHNRGCYDDALRCYADAETLWEDACVDHAPTGEGFVGSWRDVSPVGAGADGSTASVPLTVRRRLYLDLASVAVLSSAGRYSDALSWVEGAGTHLPERHPLRAALHSAHGYVLNAVGQGALAFEQFVEAMVIRAASLGRDHVDTQLAAHNLGCVLDQLGCEKEAFELLDEAHRAFSGALGGTHPRTKAACRNLAHVAHTGHRVAPSQPPRLAATGSGSGGSSPAPSAPQTPSGGQLFDYPTSPSSPGSRSALSGSGGMQTTPPRLRLIAMRDPRSHGWDGGPTSPLSARGAAEPSIGTAAVQLPRVHVVVRGGVADPTVASRSQVCARPRWPGLDSAAAASAAAAEAASRSASPAPGELPRLRGSASGSAVSPTLGGDPLTSRAERMRKPVLVDRLADLLGQGL